MIAAGHDDALPAGELNLKRAADGGTLRIQILGANPAVKPIPLARLELELLTEGRIGRLAGLDPQRLPPLVVDARVQSHFRLGPVDVSRPARFEPLGLEAGVNQRHRASRLLLLERPTAMPRPRR